MYRMAESFANLEIVKLVEIATRTHFEPIKPPWPYFLAVLGSLESFTLYMYSERLARGEKAEKKGPSRLSSRGSHHETK